tara:strand:+ start:118 stop:315 length:198 start_codon:yes stop_codon:yes gene_type:complete
MTTKYAKVRMDKNLYARITLLAERREVSISTFIRETMRSYCDLNYFKEVEYETESRREQRRPEKG